MTVFAPYDSLIMILSASEAGGRLGLPHSPEGSFLPAHCSALPFRPHHLTPRALRRIVGRHITRGRDTSLCTSPCIRMSLCIQTPRRR